VAVDEIAVDKSLKDSRINIHLDRLRIFEYPGSGRHQIMFIFKAQNQIQTVSEPVSFSQVFPARNREAAAVKGYPVFLGLSIGRTGAALQVSTVNVKNDDDENMISFLDSPVFRSGLNLLTTAQPALKPLAELTQGLAKGLLSRNKNVKVQDFFLGLDFSNAAMGAGLAEGNYIAVQVPNEGAITWDEWAYRPKTGIISRSNDDSQDLPYNYIVFRVTRSED
jgi:hypothetical protein